ncbi:TPA: YbhB/YbcL family Raf kinase inhibitor-like protein [Legionella pneumophila]|nr:YbhB/YbcL family Raf kinase inhibitor-like protein [Legionella pneumophila]HAT2065154.1 YbhB/YbcL family Raf kinase inhibitor-like protein [Legionella pneumophila]HAT8591460.1 YbhB/YbcL family Raf kinase inhibitor-like protein [Legionella pneumophila]HAU1575382.1 YbhB/YbcL family Raf kinase inhibitor-like protein [Legionella pneumophila]HAU1681665.1 YbhB/YbcL family Raf kinase inhibitor-like protein [Legionella pneumophila]HAU3699068.1 YbhB/YbcL family Raf kinase inhibitor-like protein [Leg
MSLLLTSPAFEHNDFIPDEFTCHGLDRPPPLAWENAPPNTKSFVIIMDDPDALGGLWVHWVLFNIPASYNELDAAIDLPDSAVSVKNSWGKTGYGGPCPPRGTHRYFFRLYALDTFLSLDEKATKKDVEYAMQGHILETSELICKYTKL